MKQIDQDETKHSFTLKGIAKLLDLGKQFHPMRISLRIAILYVIFGALWVLFSDKVVSFFIDDVKLFTFLTLVKGWFFILFTGCFLYVLIFYTLKRIKTMEQELVDRNEALKKMNQELDELEDFNKNTVDNMMNAFALHRMLFDESGTPCDYELVNVNAAFERFIGHTKDEMLGKKLNEYMSAGDKKTADWLEVYGEVVVSGNPVSFEAFVEDYAKWVMVHAYRPKPGFVATLYHDITDMKTHMQALQEKNSELSGLYGDLEALFIDLHATEDELKIQNAELIAYQDKLHHMAYSDHLTGLPNRMALSEALYTLVQNDPTICHAFMFIDLDNFKYINDTLGHIFGDGLIKSIGERLSESFGGNSLYRLGGDEFIIFLKKIGCIEDVREKAEKALLCFNKPFKVENSLIHATASIGIALYPDGGTTPDELLKNADIAMYRAKDSGKNCYVVYQQVMNEAVNERMRIEKNLRVALEKDEFMLYYQPQIDTMSNRIMGFEALIRWQNTELGFVSPVKFIGIAEDTHMIIPIGDWVLRNACYFIKTLHCKGYEDLSISVNVSIIQLLQDDFVEMVLNTINLIDLEPKFLELEITESIVMKSYEVIGEKLMQLRNKGIRIALDDFGSGYSSLSGLQSLQIDTLKIDKGFIDSILEEDKKKSLADTIITIGHRMGLTVLAEGVETKEQLEYLKHYRCHRIQGYYYSRPLAEKDAIDLIETSQGTIER